jgi:hypothetical protein
MHKTGARNESTERFHPDGDSIIEPVSGAWLAERGR